MYQVLGLTTQLKRKEREKEESKIGYNKLLELNSFIWNTSNINMHYGEK